MFNLLIFNSINRVDWTKSTIQIINGRKEYWDKTPIEYDLTNPNFDESLLERLKIYPCLFCNEGTITETAYVGQINQAETNGYEIILSISLDPNIPPLKNSMIYENRSDLNIYDEFEFSRSHWALKDADLYRFLMRNMRFFRRQTNVFKLSEFESIKPDLVSAMMPFTANFDAVYAAIKQASQNIELECKRADDIWENHEIIQDIVDLIDQSRIVVCDCSGRNPNVFYEVASHIRWGVR